jgi:CMP-N,N'-diacetyllegionaminic acid synthase
MTTVNEHPKVLALIPARGGSKGVKNKNIRVLSGKPLIAYTIEAARKSTRITDVLTSTDSDAIAHAAETCGSEVLRRPSELAQDDSPMAPVALHALDTLITKGRRYDQVILLQPTCPLRTTEDIDNVLTLLNRSDADAAVSVYRVYDTHPARMYRIKENRLVSYSPDQERRNRQDLEPVYHRNGSLYAILVDALRKEMTFFPPNSRPYVMPRERSLNIDEELDFEWAEFLMRPNHD